jgi:hypothetical protein
MSPSNLGIHAPEKHLSHQAPKGHRAANRDQTPKNLTQRLGAAEPQPKKNLTQSRKGAKERQDGKIFQKVNDSLR